jgi:hypothetical protein
MADGRARRVFVEMLREEWRLHGRLFNGRRFAAFPVFVTLLVAGAVELLVVTGTALESVLAGLHAFAFVFGLHTGSIGFVGRESLRNRLGNLTLLVFSARTLPLSRRRLLGIFVVKDVVYYALLFLLPMTVGVLPGTLGRTATVTGPAVTALPLLWATLTTTFVLGIGVTIAGIGLSSRGVAGSVLLVVAAGSGVGAWRLGVPVVGYTPYGVFTEPTTARAVVTLALLAVVFLLGGLAFDVDARRNVQTTKPTFRRWRRWVGDAVATKTLLDVHRSSGGFGKALFSAAVLLGVTAALVDLAGQITGVSPSVGVSFGAVLGLSGFTTYNWLTQFDDVGSYLVHPLDEADVFRAKFRAFVLLGPLVGLGFYVVAVLWRGTRPLDALAGGVVLAGVACYVFGVTVYLTGLSPNEFLFDTMLFAVFGASVVVALVPILVVAFALAPVPATALAVLCVVGVGLGIAGVLLYRRAVPKWTRGRHSKTAK